MSEFPRIDPDHPLTVAARYVNAYSEEHGLEETLRWLGLDVDVGELAYLGEQRSLRAVAAAALGMNLGTDSELDAATVRAIMATPLWRDMRMLLIGCYMDGISIGYKARELADA